MKRILKRRSDGISQHYWKNQGVAWGQQQKGIHNKMHFFATDEEAKKYGERVYFYPRVVHVETKQGLKRIGVYDDWDRFNQEAKK